MDRFIILTHTWPTVWPFLRDLDDLTSIYGSESICLVLICLYTHHVIPFMTLQHIKCKIVAHFSRLSGPNNYHALQGIFLVLISLRNHPVSPFMKLQHFKCERGLKWMVLYF